MTPRFSVPEGLFSLASILSRVACLGMSGQGDKRRADPAIPNWLHKPQIASKLTDVGLATRTVYRADGSAIYDVDVRELVATPGKDWEDLKLNGSALLEVCSGSGLAIVSGQTRELHRGSTLEIDNGALFTLAATGSAPVVLRAHVVRAR